MESSLRIFADFLLTEMLIGSNGQRNLAIASSPKLNKTLDSLKSQIPRFLWHGSVQEQQTRVYCTDELEAMISPNLYVFYPCILLSTTLVSNNLRYMLVTGSVK